MKRLLFLLTFTGAVLAGQDLSGVHSVYLLPMSRGLDQYLANQLTREHLFQVVTDPKLADAVFTDQIGEEFEQRLTELAGNSEPVSSPPSENEAAGQPPSGGSKPPNPQSSTFGRTRGTVFLVHPKTHRVLWSAYQPPKSSSSDDMNRAASAIVSRLQRDLKTK